MSASELGQALRAAQKQDFKLFVVEVYDMERVKGGVVKCHYTVYQKRGDKEEIIYNTGQRRIMTGSFLGDGFITDCLDTVFDRRTTLQEPSYEHVRDAKSYKVTYYCIKRNSTIAWPQELLTS
jgi:hypothetical protein